MVRVALPIPRGIFHNRKRHTVSPTNPELLSDTRRDLRERYSSPDPGTSVSGDFITKEAIREVLSAKRLKDLFQHCQWYSPGVLSELNSMIRVVAILILIEWKDWGEFKTRLLNRRDQRRRPVRGDHNLPFSPEQLGFLSEQYYRNQFRIRQYEVCPIVITQHRHMKYSAEFKLPFLRSKPLKDGAFGSVKAVEVEKSQLYTYTGVGEFWINQKVI